jgi:hypothetical protein
MLESFTHTHFTPLLGEVFDAEGAELKLTEIEPLGSASPAQRQPFSLLFHGPRAPLLEQRIYGLEHASVGRLAIFLVPIGPDAQGQRYQAIFS